MKADLFRPIGYPLRHIPEGGALVEITVRTMQGRYLLRPDERGRVNELVLGVIGRAQQLTSISIVGISVLSSHFHVLAVPESAKQMADFMRHVNANISDEIGRLHDWPGTLLVRRYRAIPVSNEEEVQVARLRYLLAAGVKEQLVEKAIDWPGVHSARALTRDHPLRGWWYDRSQEYADKRRGKHFGRFDHATEMTVKLDPLPCWRHLPIEDVRRRVKDLIRELEREAPLHRQATERPVRGAEAVMAFDPHFRPPNSPAHRLLCSMPDERTFAKRCGMRTPGSSPSTARPPSACGPATGRPISLREHSHQASRSFRLPEAIQLELIVQAPTGSAD